MKLTGFYLFGKFILKAFAFVFITIIDVVAVVIGAIFSMFAAFCRMLQMGSVWIVRKTFFISDYLEDLNLHRHE